MSRFRNISLTATILGGLGAAACDESPLAPTADTAAAGTAGAASKPPAPPLGVYELAFLANGQVVTTLPVLTAEMVLRMHVEDSQLHDAQSGTVLFEYCSYRGLPTNDPARADEAPSAACANGLARWRRLGSDTVDSSGDASQFFGVVQFPRTVGFRATYQGNRTIALHTVGPVDFEWTPQ